MGDLKFTPLDDKAKVWFANAAAWNQWFSSILVDMTKVQISEGATTEVAGAVKVAEQLEFAYTIQTYPPDYFNQFQIETTEGLKTVTSITKDSFDKLKANVDELKAILDELKSNMIAAGQLEPWLLS